MGAVEMDILDGLVGGAAGGGKIGSPGGDAEYTATAGDYVVAVPGGAGVEDFGGGEFSGIVEAGDDFSFFDWSRVTFGGHHNTDRWLGAPLHFDLVQSS